MNIPEKSIFDVKNLKKTNHSRLIIIGLTLLVLTIGVMLGQSIINSKNTMNTVLLVNEQGEIIEENEFKSSAEIDLPTLTKEGHTFLGWYNGNTLVTSGTFSTSAILIARFSINQYTIVLNGLDQSLTLSHGSDLNLPTPKIDGFGFLGWYEDAVFNTPFTETTATRSLTLYPKLVELGETQVSLIVVSDYLGLIVSEIVEIGYELELPTLTRPEHVFVGYYEIPGDESTKYENGDIVDRNLLLIAVFRPLSPIYKVTFDTGDAEPIDPIYVREGEPLPELTNPSLFGYQFVGWVYNVQFDGFNVSSRDVDTDFVVTENVTLFAKFDYMIPGANIFYQPYRLGNRVLGYRITDITYETDEEIPYLILPSTYLGMPVVAITNWAFENIDYINEVVVPEGYIEISNGAFAYSSIQTIHLPKSLGFIGDEAFLGSQIETIHVHEDAQIHKIGSSAFAETENLKHFNLNAYTKEIDYSAFRESALETITVPENALLSVIRGEAFNRTQVKTIDLPEGLTIIGENAFSQSALETIVIPSTVYRLEYDAFKQSNLLDLSFVDATKLEFVGRNTIEETPLSETQSIVIVDNVVLFADDLSSLNYDVILPEGVVMIAEDVFSYKTINNLSLPSSLRVIRNAFNYSSFQNAFSLPQHLVNIQNAFYASTSNAEFEIVIPESVDSAYYAFGYANMPNVRVVVEFDMQIDSRFNAMFTSATFNEITLTSNVENIPNDFFSNTSLNQLIIENEQMMTGYNAIRFNRLDVLNTPSGFEFIPYYESSFYGLHDKNWNSMIDENGYKTFANILVDSYDFDGTIDIPFHVTVINQYALAYNFNTLNLNNVEYIMQYAFQERNYSLNAFTLVLTEHVKFISNIMNYDWVERSVTFDVTNMTTQADALMYKTDPTYGVLQALPFNEQGFKLFGDIVLDYDSTIGGTDVVLPSHVTAIARYAFNNQGITSITNLSQLTFIGSYALAENPDIDELYILPANDYYYDIYVFDTIPPLAYQDVTVFIDNRSLDFYEWAVNQNQADENGFVIINGEILVKYIGKDKNIVIPEGVKIILGQTFNNSLVESLTLPSSLIALNDDALYGAVFLKELIYPETMSLEFIGSYAFNYTLLRYVDLPTAIVTDNDAYTNYIQTPFEHWND